MTITEMAKKLKLPKKTIALRLYRKGHKPISYEAQYSLEAFEDIKKSNPPGRPRSKPPKKKPKK